MPLPCRTARCIGASGHYRASTYPGLLRELWCLDYTRAVVRRIPFAAALPSQTVNLARAFVPALHVLHKAASSFLRDVVPHMNARTAACPPRSGVRTLPGHALCTHLFYALDRHSANGMDGATVGTSRGSPAARPTAHLAPLYLVR